VTEENSDKKKDEEEGDTTEQAPVLPRQGVYKQNLVMHQSVGDVHNNTDYTSDDETIQTPSAPQGISKWGQVTSQTVTPIHSLVT
jgi:hypothetical protein